jgi:DNA-binding transcriptional regulator GbsR (MarR family)
MESHATEDLLISAWIDLGICFGFSRTATEVHALLYICGRPQCTDDVMARLNLSRGNVSICLRTLRDWWVVWYRSVRRPTVGVSLKSGTPRCWQLPD